MIQLIPLPNNPPETRWLLIIVGENNGFANEMKHFSDPVEAMNHGIAWLMTEVPI